jgi:microcystin-dependent protein
MEFKIGNSMYMQMYPNGVVSVGGNQIFNKQLVLYDTNSSDTPSTATNYYGFGVNSHVLRYQVDSTASGHKFYGGTTNYASIDNTGITTNNVTTSSFSLIPPGVIINSIVTISSSVGYLLCDGSAVSRTTYSALYTALGTVYGGGNGSTTFNLPDFRGAFLRGYGTNTNSTYVGGSLGSPQSDSVGSHSHTITSGSPNNGFLYNSSSAMKGIGSAGTATVVTGTNFAFWPSSTDSAGSTETRPFNYSVYYYIKY